MNKQQTKLCVDHMDFSNSIARKLYKFYVRYNKQFTIVDSEQTAYLGLCKACIKYDKSSKLDFKVFAANWFIKPELINFFYKNLLTVNFDFRKAVDKVKEYLQDHPGEQKLPSIAKYADLTEESTEYVLSIIWGLAPDKSLIKVSKDVELMGSTSKADSLTIKNELERSLSKEIKRLLTNREAAYILGKTFGLSNKDIAADRGTSESNVSTTIKTAMLKLKKSRLLEELHNG